MGDRPFVNFSLWRYRRTESRRRRRKTRYRRLVFAAAPDLPDQWPRADLVPFVRRVRDATSANFKPLVLFCIEADRCVQIFIFQHFSRSTRFAHFCTARNSNFWRNLSNIFRKLSTFFDFSKIFMKFLILLKIAKFLKKKATFLDSRGAEL